MRPYVPNDKVGDIGSELPHYYCNLHNPDPDSYPTEPGVSVTIVAPPATLPDDEEDQPSDSGDSGSDSGSGDSGETGGGEDQGSGGSGSTGDDS